MNTGRDFRKKALDKDSTNPLRSCCIEVYAMAEIEYQIVWLKRDLRLQDHQPLFEAAKTGQPVMLLYVFEPALMEAPDYDVRHARFVWQSLQSLLRQLPVPASLFILQGSMPEILDQLHARCAFLRLYSHQETGNQISYQRDIKVTQWCRQKQVLWQEYNDRGIMRGLKKRNNWPGQWYAYMHMPKLTINLSMVNWVSEVSDDLSVVASFEALFPGELPICAAMQPGGSDKGQQYLRSFLQTRGMNYQRHISKPEAARISCGRLSPYLAYGCLSLRQVYQATKNRMAEAPHMKKPLDFFLQRLRWHSHFIQKLETAPALELYNTNPGFDHMRQEIEEALLEAWKTGKTGYPLVDACMRCVAQTGYLNFRMRAMLVSFLTHHLWQPWQAGVHHLARYFLDYEPGIHFPQFQMQAGVTGINTIRIYNPVKQGEDHDPEGLFVKKWCPELQGVPTPFIHTPWELTEMEQQACGCRIGTDYPKPVIDLQQAAKQAREALWKQKKSGAVRQNNARILSGLSGRKSEEEEGA